MGLARWGISLVGLLVLLVAAPPAGALEQRLVAGDGAAGDALGRSVAIDGNTAVVGTGVDDQGRGAVYVFGRFGDSWVQVARLTASDRALGDDLGNSVAIDGNVIVAGAPGDDIGGNNQQGSVYTFSRTGAAQRTQTAKLTASDGAGAHFLGDAVDIDGDRIVAGAALANGLNGAVYVFASTGPTPRQEIARLTASDPSPISVTGDELGTSVAIDGDTIVAGAHYHSLHNVPGDPQREQQVGAVYTFTRNGSGTRQQTAKLMISDDPGWDREFARFGQSVDIDGDTIVAGPENQAAVYTFATSGAANRTQTARLTPSSGGGGIGHAVAAGGVVILAGSPTDDGFKGSFFIFDRTGGDRQEELRIQGAAANGQFGESVATDGVSLVVGRPGEKIGDNAGQGSALVYYGPAPQTYVCSDGLDNDKDTRIDFPADPGCSGPMDDSEINALGGVDCDDGADNDNDGKIDYPDDTGCERPGDPSELGKQCRDGLDNDGDGLVDFPKDKGCKSATDGSEGPPMKLALKAPKKVEKGKKAKLVATLGPCPRLADLEVRFQKKTKTGFKGIGKADAKEPDCKAKLKRTVNKKTVFRAVTKRARGYLGATSDTVTVKIRAPQR